MSRLASPPANVPTLTDVVDLLAQHGPDVAATEAPIGLTRELQKKVVRRVMRRLAKSLKARLRKAGQQRTGETRQQLFADLRGEIENAVGDAVNQAFAQQDGQAVSMLKKRQIRAEK